jgi:crotonobetainyl-CoA:carnitine CoA-transferase CaiB-like acyl-CoA transferase
VFRTRSTQQWLEALEALGIPCAPIQDFAQVLAQPQTEAIGIFQTIPGEELRIVGLPLSFDGERPRVRHRAPGVGEHNEALGAKAPG